MKMDVLLPDTGKPIIPLEVFTSRTGKTLTDNTITSKQNNDAEGAA
ncbi:hypothetical protein [Desulfoscipio gibsoniae]|nr:hypothetical protein [Desulfoscipio gibsoniae]